MGNHDVELMAHLMRRAGFGAKREEVETRAAKGYDATVDELVDFGEVKTIPEDLIRRYHPDAWGNLGRTAASFHWMYRMIYTDAPLEEKMTLFWHGIFATGYQKVTQGQCLEDQITMFRKYGMGNFRDLLVELSKNPAMIIWLDNQDNHSGAINENYGRELLELFSMGVGNYSEDDIKEASRAFTGWTIANTEYMELKATRDSIWPYGRLAWRFEYRPEDHDDGEKTVLGRTGNFNGEDVVDIICEQPATARFLARHMYHFFVADEPLVPQWPYVPPRDPEAIEELCQAYFDNNYSIREMLRTLFKSEFFKSKDCWYEKVKSPAALIAGDLRTSEEFRWPGRKIVDYQYQLTYMGQSLYEPPSVEGWNEGTGWIDTGNLVERMNFSTQQLGNSDNAGIKDLAGRIVEDGGHTMPAESLVDACLYELGALIVPEQTREALVEFASNAGGESANGDGDARIVNVLRLIAATPEYQRC